MEENFERVYQLKTMLKDSRPPIWRRIQIPETHTLWDLHVAIQDAMGWEDYHLHEFRVTNPDGWEKISIKPPEWDQKVSYWFNLENSHLNYVYDFGDYWDHKVEVEKLLPREEGVDYPICIKGKRNCPPEDCGGLGGYEELLEILQDPSHEEYEEMKEWVEEDFDPEHFNPEEVVFSDPDELRKYADV